MDVIITAVSIAINVFQFLMFWAVIIAYRELDNKYKALGGK